MENYYLKRKSKNSNLQVFEYMSKSYNNVRLKIFVLSDIHLSQIRDVKYLEKVKKEAFFELIFMTYSYVHNAINTEAFPNRPNLYDKEQMTGRGKGKYMYKHEVREEAEKEIRAVMKQYFPNNEIKYIV